MSVATSPWASRFITVDGLQFRYLEAGPAEAEPVVLLHLGEYGASAEFSWENNIGALAKEFHVIAPDMIGYGHSAKVFDFGDPLGFRIRTVRRFCEEMHIAEAQFMGNSMGGTLMCYVASQVDVVWPMRTMVLVSGGGNPLENEYRTFIQQYDGTFENMDAHTALTFTHRWYDDEYIARRVNMSKVLEPGSASQRQGFVHRSGNSGQSSAFFDRFAMKTLGFQLYFSLAESTNSASLAMRMS